jgi:uncharacterized Zn finger protein (UPF0148 family)
MICAIAGEGALASVGCIGAANVEDVCCWFAAPLIRARISGDRPLVCAICDDDADGPKSNKGAKKARKIAARASASQFTQSKSSNTKRNPIPEQRSGLAGLGSGDITRRKKDRTERARWTMILT